MSDTPRTDAILAKIPGGQTCDPQLVADDLRVPIAELERELAAERALADRLAASLTDIEGRAGDTTITLHPDADAKGCVDDCWQWSEQALAAWKEARRDP